MKSNRHVQTTEESADVIEVIVIPDDPPSSQDSIVPSVSSSCLSYSSSSGYPDQAFSNIPSLRSSTASIDSSNVSASIGERKRKMSPGCSNPDPQKPKRTFVAVKKGSPTDDELEELGNKIGQKWKKLGRRLGFKEPKLQDIEQRHRELCEKGYHMLMDWKQEYGSAATYETLNAALQHEHVLRKDLAEKICYQNDGELHIKVEVAYLKEVQCRRASAASPTVGSVSHSRTEDPQALKESAVLCSIASRYLQIKPLQSVEDLNEFMEYMRKMRVIITGVSVGSLKITVKCESLQILEELWADYSCGHLGTMVQNCFVTEKILKELNLAELKLKTTMDIEEYNARKVYFERVALRAQDALSPQSYFISSEDQAPLERWKQKTEVWASGIMKVVFNAAIGWLVDKGRDKAAEKLQSGDVTDQRFRGIIMREIDDLNSKLDGISRREVLASISVFSEGIELLYKVFEETRPRSEYSADTAQAACAEAVSLTEGMQNLELTEAPTRNLVLAKERFKCARERATDAFSNAALSTSDRILAAQYRVMSTALETIDNPADAVAPCKVCIKELNGLPVVQKSLKVQLKTGISAVKRRMKKKERRKLLAEVYRVNRIAYDVTQTVSAKEPLPQWPMVNIGEEKVDILRDGRVTGALRKQGMENCSVLWILGHDGEGEHKIIKPRDVATNSSGHYIVADNDLTIKVFDNSGKFVKRFRPPSLIDDSGNELLVADDRVRLATDRNDNICVLVREKGRKDSYWIYKFNKTADQHHTFPVRKMSFEFDLFRLSVSDSGKVVVLRGYWREHYGIVDVYETDGQFVCSFGEQILRYPWDITTVSDDRVMVVDLSSSRCFHIFSEQGEHLNKFDLQGSPHRPSIAFHKESQQVVLASEELSTHLLYIEIYTKDGEFVRSTLIHVEKLHLPYGITVTTEGRIAVAAKFQDDSYKVIII